MTAEISLAGPVAATVHVVAGDSLAASSAALGAVRSALSEFGATIRTTTELSAQAIAFGLAAPVADAEAWRERRLAISADHACEVFDLGKPQPWLPRLVCFDMDSTLIQVEVIDELAKRAGVGDRVVAITESAMRGEIDFGESFRQRVSLLQGLDATTLQTVAAGLPLSPGAETLCHQLQRLGCRTAILSGGFTVFGAHLQGLLHIDQVVANQLEIVDGKLTGRHLGPIIDASAKAANLTRLAAEYGIPLTETMAVGDGANDLQMLATAGVGVAYHAKPVVRAQAAQAINHLGLDALLPALGLSAGTLASLARQA